MDGGGARRPGIRTGATKRPGARLSSTEQKDGEASEQECPSPVVSPDRAKPPGGVVFGGILQRRPSATKVVHQRHMPMEPLKFQIPRKNKEKIALFQYVSSESREYEDMLNILSSSFRDTASAGTFVYSRPRLVHNQKLETEYVEKRKEMKADSRTDKELEDMYCFLLTADSEKSKEVCESGLSVGYSWITALGNPSKGVYLSKYSDLLQINAIIPGATGEIVICKVMKGKVKSMYDNMSKNLLDPTPKFDCHISKNASKVTSLTSYRAYELSQLYFYEYSFDLELITRPRQVCPYAVLSFQFKGKDPLPSKPLAISRMDSQTPACPPKGSNERVQYTVWSGDLVKGDRCLYHVSLRSFSPPVLPCKLPELLEIGCLMSFDHVCKLLPPALFCWKLYAGSHEVVKNDMFCSLLEMTERSKSGNDLSRLLQELEKHNLVLVETLNDRGVLILLSSEQMATPTERGDGWKRALQALFIFPESRDVGRSVSPCTSSHDAPETTSVIGRLSTFLPALHHALVKARANPPSDLSGGVVKSATDYLSGLKDGLTRVYPMGEYDAKLDDRGKLFPAPKHHKANMEGYLRNYLYGPTLYLVSVARARNLLVTNLGSDYLEQERKRINAARLGGRLAEERADLEKERERSNGGAEEERMQDQTNSQKNQGNIFKKILDTMMSFPTKKRGEGELGKKRKKEEEVTERTSKYLRGGGQERTPGLSQSNPSPPEEQGEEESEPWTFDRLATRLQLPTNCDLDLRTQEELEEQTRGSVSSLEEGFSPGSHCGESGLRGRGEGDEQPEIPWILIPITGVKLEPYHRIQSKLPQDPRCQPVAMASANVASANVASAPTARPTPSPELSPAPSPPAPSPPTPSPPPNEPAVTPSEITPFKEEPSPANEQRLTSLISRESAGTDVKDSPYLPAADESNREIENNPDPSPLSSLLSVIGSEGLTDIDLRSESPQAALKLLHLLKEATKESRGEISIPPSAPPSAPPSIHPTPEKQKSRTPSPRPTLEQQEVAGGKEEVEGGGQLEKKEEVEGKESNQGEKKDTEAREPEAEEVHMVEDDGQRGGEVIELSDEERGGGEVMEVLSDDSPPSSPTPVAPPAPQNVDCIIEDLMGHFSSDIQHLLQEESTNYTSMMQQFPPNNAMLHKHARLAQTHLTIAPFSQYVTFYSSKIPGVPVQPFVSSLRDSMNGVVQDLEPRWPSNQANVGTNADANDTLASSVSVFVAGIRAATANVSSTEANSPNCTSSTAVTVASVGETPSLAKRPHSQQQNNRTELSNGDLSSSLPLSSTSACSAAYDSSTKSVGGPPHRLPTSVHSLSQQHKDIDNSRTFGHEGSLSRLTEESCNAGDVRMSDNDSLHKLPPGGSLQEDVNSGPGSASLIGLDQGPAPPPDIRSLISQLQPEVLDQGPAPPDIRSLISQLQPEVFSSLQESIKYVKKNSVQFYIHSTEEYDMHYDHIKDHLLKQGHTEQSPITFMENESTEDRLLIIIQNKDIEKHIHKIPGLMRLKQRPSVVFYGVDTVDDLRNNSPNELFVSGGCIVSDEFVLNPDFITHERLAALLMFLEQKSSPECLWRWRVHFKTMKKLKEQARFKREAKSLLEVLTNYQKRLILEILPYHHCDRTSSKSPELECLIELQARYISHRHVIFLTERRFEMFPNFSSSGIIVANINDITHNFSNVVGYHGSKSQAIPDDLLDLKGVGSRQPSTEDSALGSDLSTPSQDNSTSSSSSCTDHHPLPPHPLLHPSLSDQPTPRPSAPGSASSCHPPSSATLSSSDELLPLLPLDTDFEALRLAISQFREERRVRRQEQQEETPRAESGVGPHSSFPLDSNISSPVGGQMEQIHVAPRGSRPQMQLTHSKTTGTLDSEQAAQKLKEAVGVQLSQPAAVGKAGTERVKEKPGKPPDSDTMLSDSDMSLCGSQDSSPVQSKNMAAAQSVEAVATVPNSHSDAAGLATGNRDGGRAGGSYTNPAGVDKTRSCNLSADRPIGGLVAAAPGNVDNTAAVPRTATTEMPPGRVNNTAAIPSIVTRVTAPGNVKNTAAIPSIVSRVTAPSNVNNTAELRSIVSRATAPGNMNNTAVTRSVAHVAAAPGNVGNTVTGCVTTSTVMPTGNMNNTAAVPRMNNTTVTRGVTNVAGAPVNVDNAVTAPSNAKNTTAVTSGVATATTPGNLNNTAVTRTTVPHQPLPQPLPRLHQLQQQIVHHQNQLQQQSRHLQPGSGLLGPGSFHQHNPLLGFGGALLGPVPMPFSHPLMWGVGVPVRGPYNPDIQGNSRFRGRPRGGFNGM